MGYIMNLRKLVGHRTLIMPAAGLIIGNGQGRVLLQRRVDNGLWANHGGAVEIDERVEDALLREVKEELGIDPLEPQLLGVYSGADFHMVYPNGDEVSGIDIVYYCHQWLGEFRLQEEEVSEVRWFNADALPENMMNHHRGPIRDYLDKIKPGR